LATFDPQAILDAVDAGTAPDNWKVYRAKSSYFWGQGLTNVFIALLFSSLLILPVVLIIMFRTEIRIPWDQGGTYGVLLIAILMLLVVMYAWTDGINQLAQVRSAKKQVLALTPYGVVGRMGKQANPAFATSAFVAPTQAWDGAQDGRSFAIPYDTLRSVRLNVTHSKYEQFVQLMLTLGPSARQYLWRIDNRFPDTDIIAQSIIEAHARYIAQQAAAQ
jgi:hypothetical protein